MPTVFSIPQPSVAVVGSDSRFPVHRIYCVGRNYADHAREMGSNPDREAPFFFCKPADAVVGNHSTLPFPSLTQDLHHEIELVVALSGGGANIDPGRANELIYGYAVGIDLTRRDIQAEAKKLARPWDTAKGFDNSAPLSAITPVDRCGILDGGEINLSINGEVRQQGDIGSLIWSVPEIIAELSRYFTLQPGDLIFTGTPAGVGAIGPGDELTGEIEKLETLKIKMTSR